MTNLVTKLRSSWDEALSVVRSAADEIERLQKEVDDRPSLVIYRALRADLRNMRAALQEILTGKQSNGYAVDAQAVARRALSGEYQSVEPRADDACPFCGERWRYTDPAGSCGGCGAPEDLANERNTIVIAPWDEVAQLVRKAKARRAQKSESGAPRGEAGDRAGPMVSPQEPVGDSAFELTRQIPSPRGDIGGSGPPDGPAVKSSGSSYFDREDAILTRANSILRELVGIGIEDNGGLGQLIQRATRLLVEWESPVEISAPQGDELRDLYELKFLCREWNNAEKAAYQLSMSKDPNKPSTGSPEWQKVFSAAEKAWVDVDTWFKRHHP